MSRAVKTLLLLAGVLAIAAFAVGMGIATGRWIPAVGLLVGIVPIGFYGLVILVGSQRAGSQLDDGGH